MTNFCLNSGLLALQAPCNWFKNYLSNRQHFVSFDSCGVEPHIIYGGSHLALVVQFMMCCTSFLLESKNEITPQLYELSSTIGVFVAEETVNPESLNAFPSISIRPHNWVGISL